MELTGSVRCEVLDLQPLLHNMPPYVELEHTPLNRGQGFYTLDGRFGPLKFPVRMHVVQYTIRESDKTGLVVISPLDPTPDILSWLKGLGDVTYIVAPNKVTLAAG